MIRLTDDLGAPLAVFGADWATQAIDARSAGGFKWNAPVGIGIAATGYVIGGWLGYGKTFLKNMGIASFDWAANSVKDYIQVGGAASKVGRRVSVRPTHRISRYPAPAYTDQFQGVKLE